MLFLNILDDVVDFMGDILNIVWYLLCLPVYAMIRNGFNVFIRIAEVNILSVDTISTIYRNITLLISIIMVFYIGFEMIKYTMEPDTISDKQKGAGQIVKRIVTSIILIAFVPKIFEYSYVIQAKLIKSQIFSKIIVGSKYETPKSYGSAFTADVFKSFFVIDNTKCKKNGDCDKVKEKIDDISNNIATTGTPLSSVRTLFVTFRESVQFEGLLALIFGIYVCWVLIMYSIDVGTRYFQMILLQLIAPIAIISNIVPQKDDMLKKWTKQCITTYVDLFIRIAILYFVMMVINVLSSALDTNGLTTGLDGDRAGLFVKLFLIAGLLRFAQKAPKMLKDLFPTGGAASIGFGTGAKERFDDIGKSVTAIKKPIAATAGALTGAKRALRKPTDKWKRGAGLGKNLKNWWGTRNNDVLNGSKDQRFGRRAATYATSMFKAGFKGAQAGAKNGRFTEARMAGMQSVQKDEAIVNNGGTVLGAQFRGSHYQDVKTSFNTEIENYKFGKKMKDAAEEAAEKTSILKNLKAAIDGAQDADTRIRLQQQFNAVKDKIIDGTINAETTTVINYTWTDEQGHSHNAQTGELKLKESDAPLIRESNIYTNRLKDAIDSSEQLQKVLKDLYTDEHGRPKRNPDGTVIYNGGAISESLLKKDLSLIVKAFNATATEIENDTPYREASANASGDKK